MISVPVAIPVTNPPVTVALLVVALQVPPGKLSVNVIAAAAHTIESPVIVPAEGMGLTVIIFVAIAVPQVFVTE